jgi:hypothetical protein
VRTLLVMAAATVALLAPAPALAKEVLPPPCTGFTAGKDVGAVADEGVVELSGIVASRAHPGVVWVHNDSGAPPEVYALSSTGGALGRYAVDGAEARDWEDIGIGPGPDAATNYLYVADIGDNGSVRDHVTVYRVAEPEAAPDGTGGTLPLEDALTIRYPDGPADAESLFVDPRTGDLYILTKRFNGETHVLRAPADSLRSGRDITMQDVAQVLVLPPGPGGDGSPLPGTAVTAADISPDGSLILVRTYQDVLGFRRPAGGSVADAFSSAPCSAPSLEEAQGESIAFTADGAAYLTSSEGSGPQIQRFGVDPPRAAPSSSAPAGKGPATTAPPVLAVDGSGSSWVGPVLAVAAVVVALAIGAVVVGRRRRAG